MAKTIADLLVKIGADTSDLRKELAATKRQLNTAFGSEAMAFSTSMVEGAAIAGTALVGLGAYAVKTAGDFQSVQVAMTNMLGSAEKAQAFISDLQAFAAKTPFDFQGLSKASQKLLAFGFTAEQVIPTMTAIGDAASALGAGQEGIDKITLALGQMAAKGKVQSDEMLQLTEAGIPAWKMLADTIGTSIPEAMDKVSKSQVTAQQGLEALVNGMESQFGGLMDQQSTQILGSWNNLMDGLEQSAAAVGMEISDSLELPGLFSSLGEQFQQFARDVQSVGITQALKDLIPPDLEVTLIAVGGALGGIMAAGLYALAGAAAAALAPFLPFIAAGAALALVIGVLIDPIGTVSGLLEVLGFSSYDANAAAVEFTNTISSLIDWISSGISAVSGFIGEFTSLTGAISAAASALSNFISKKSQAYHGLTSEDESVKKYQKQMSGEGGLRVLSYDEDTHTFTDDNATFTPQDFSNFSGGAPVVSGGGGGGGSGGGGGAASAANRLASEADRTSKQIKDLYERTFDTAAQAADNWYNDQLDKLNKSKSANENYEEDLTKLNAVYEQKRRKAAEDEANEEIRLFEKVHSAAQDSLQTRNVYGSASQQELASMEMDYQKTIDGIRKRWQQFETEYIGMTDRERAALLKQLDEQGIAYQTYEDGRLSLATQTAEDIAAAEKSYNDKKLKYYAQVKDLQADIDEAYSRVSLSMLKSSLTAENAERLAAYNEQKDAMDAFYENWQEINQTSTDKIIGSIQDSKNSFDTFFSDVLTGSQSFLESLTDLFTDVWGNIVSNFTSSWGASISNSLLGAFGIGDTSGTTSGDTSGTALGDTGGGLSSLPMADAGGFAGGGSGSIGDIMGGFANSVVASTAALGSNSSMLGTATGLLSSFGGTTQKGASLLGAYNTIQGLLNTATKPQEATTTITATTALGAFTQATVAATIALKSMSAAGGIFGFAEGGAISGPGSGTSDSIPARLSNGEYVLNAKAVKKWGLPLLNALNEGRMPAFAAGGLVARPKFNKVGISDIERAFNGVIGGSTQNVNVSQNIYGDINTGADSEELMNDFSAAILAGLRGG